jgi:DNA-binding PadR family transcriptional regulator
MHVADTPTPRDVRARSRFYELTAAGRKQLVAERKQWERFSHALGLILETD